MISASGAFFVYTQQVLLLTAYLLWVLEHKEREIQHVFVLQLCVIIQAENLLLLYDFFRFVLDKGIKRIRVARVVKDLQVFNK